MKRKGTPTYLGDGRKRFKPGDLIGFSSYDLSGLVINLGSLGVPFFGISHIGIIADCMGSLRLYESTTLCKLPCLVQKKPVSGAQVHNIDSRIRDFNGKVYHIPLKDELSKLESIKLKSYLLKDIGKPYDMLGAGASGGWLLQKIRRYLKPEDLNNLFCSEWCAAGHNHVKRFHTGNASKWNPNSLYRAERKRGVVSKRIRIK